MTIPTTCFRLRVVSALILVAFCLTACRTAPNSALDQTSLHERATAAVRAEETHLIAFRHDLHRYPELSGQEQRTSAKIAEQLVNLGYEVRANVGGYGVVGILRANLAEKQRGPTIAFRADMDASRDASVDPVPYASKVAGVRHNCGHDVHSTIGVGLAIGFASVRDALTGDVVLIFQPAEESGTGADAMLADSAMDDIHPDAILAVHTFPLEVGELATTAGALIAGRARIAVTLTGDGDLSAAADQVHAALINVSTVTGAEALQPMDPGFIYVELAQPRTHPVDQVAFVSGLVMSTGIAGRAAVRESVLRAINGIELEGIEIQIEYGQALEGVNNDAETVRRAWNGISTLTPELRVQQFPKVFPAFSEDFGSFQRTIPGVMFFVGVNNPAAGTVGFPHSPDYVADDGAILVGVEAMLAASFALMDP
ncbi:MAG: M20 family metallopeptidase [Pseudomonadota bacterium]